MKKLTAQQNAILNIIRKHGPIDLDGLAAKAKLRRFDVVQAAYALVEKDRVLVDDDGVHYRINPGFDPRHPIEPRGFWLEGLLTYEECEAPGAADWPGVEGLQPRSIAQSPDVGAPARVTRDYSSPSCHICAIAYAEYVCSGLAATEVRALAMGCYDVSPHIPIICL